MAEKEKTQRTPAREALSWVLSILVAVAVALVLAGLFVAQDYLVYTDEGLRLELPFFLPQLVGLFQRLRPLIV